MKRLVLRRAAGICVAALTLAVFSGRLQAVEPQLGSIAPYGVQRGTDVELVFGGGRLADAKELLFYSPGFTVKSLEAADNAVKAQLTVAPDCRLGIHAVRLRTATGVSNLRTFTVGTLPEVKEVEPNNDFLQPQVIQLDVTVSGIVQNEDIDQFVVELKKGQRLSAELEGLRLGNTFFDPYVAILNAARFELDRSDDAALLSQDCLCSIVAPEDGKYIVQIRESSFGGNGACTYRLHVGTFPRPTAAFPPGGKPGETLQVRWIGDAAGDFTQEITLPTDGSIETNVVAQDASGQAPSPNVLRVIDLANSNEVEPNDAVPQATPAAAAPLAMNGILEKEGDIDFFKFSAKKGQQLDVRVYARNPLRSPLDSVLVVYNAQGGGIA
ncbi:MAG TPA: serine protease, partial [Pirellulaceae bacterium]|nr:serine protease [Pirellulaceae bacterium]